MSTAYWKNVSGSNINTAANWFSTASTTVGLTATVTIANPAVITVTAHGYSAGDAVVLTTTGALPTGITSGTTYYAGTIATNTFNLYDTSAHAIAGGSTGCVTTTGSQSGIHTCTGPSHLGGIPWVSNSTWNTWDLAYATGVTTTATLNVTFGVSDSWVNTGVCSLNMTVSNTIWSGTYTGNLTAGTTGPFRGGSYNTGTISLSGYSYYIYGTANPSFTGPVTLTSGNLGQNTSSTANFYNFTLNGGIVNCGTFSGSFTYTSGSLSGSTTVVSATNWTTWLGTVSINQSTAGNWSNGLPSGINALYSGKGTYQPASAIPASTVYNASSLTFGVNGSCVNFGTISSNISGNLTNYAAGTLSGTVGGNLTNYAAGLTGTLSVTGTVTNQAGGIINGITANSTANNVGTVTGGNWIGAYTSSGNTTGGTFGIISNSGGYIAPSSGNIIVSGMLINTGNVAGGAYSLTVNGPVTNIGGSISYGTYLHSGNPGGTITGGFWNPIGFQVWGATGITFLLAPALDSSGNGWDGTYFYLGFAQTTLSSHGSGTWSSNYYSLGNLCQRVYLRYGSDPWGINNGYTLPNAVGTTKSAFFNAWDRGGWNVLDIGAGTYDDAFSGGLNGRVVYDDLGQNGWPFWITVTGAGYTTTNFNGVDFSGHFDLGAGEQTAGYPIFLISDGTVNFGPITSAGGDDQYGVNPPQAGQSIYLIDTVFSSVVSNGGSTPSSYDSFNAGLAGTISIYGTSNSSSAPITANGGAALYGTAGSSGQILIDSSAVGVVNSCSGNNGLYPGNSNNVTVQNGSSTGAINAFSTTIQYNQGANGNVFVDGYSSVGYVSTTDGGFNGYGTPANGGNLTISNNSSALGCNLNGIASVNYSWTGGNGSNAGNLTLTNNSTIGGLSILLQGGSPAGYYSIGYGGYMGEGGNGGTGGVVRLTNSFITSAINNQGGAGQGGGSNSYGGNGGDVYTINSYPATVNNGAGGNGDYNLNGSPGTIHVSNCQYTALPSWYSVAAFDASCNFSLDRPTTLSIISLATDSAKVVLPYADVLGGGLL